VQYYITIDHKGQNLVTPGPFFTQNCHFSVTQF
jgi:hypothetical protein